MTTYYKATFSNGRTLRRATKSRTYSYAYLVERRDQDYTWATSGFSRTERLAIQAMHSLKRFSTTFFEVAPAVEIDASEYRRLA